MWNIHQQLGILSSEIRRMSESGESHVDAQRVSAILKRMYDIIYQMYYYEQ